MSVAYQKTDKARRKKKAKDVERQMAEAILAYVCLLVACFLFDLFLC